MQLVVFGLTVSSSWGNGHATLWRGLIDALARAGCAVTFFERDLAWYRDNRDLDRLEGAELILYREWDEVLPLAARRVAAADAALVTSYCPDGRAAAALVCEEARESVFYDMDTPVTLERWAAGETVPYLPAAGLGGFDLVLSFTGGAALTRLAGELGARRALPLYGHVDPERHRPTAPESRFQADLSYLGTFAPDRQPALEALFLETAAARPERRFLIGGPAIRRTFPGAKTSGSPGTWRPASTPPSSRARA